MADLPSLINGLIGGGGLMALLGQAWTAWRKPSSAAEMTAAGAATSTAAVAAATAVTEILRKEVERLDAKVGRSIDAHRDCEGRLSAAEARLGLSELERAELGRRIDEFMATRIAATGEQPPPRETTPIGA